MQGEKIRKAREAARMAVSRLSSRDIVSVVAYDSTVQVLVPATKLTDKEPVYEAIGRLGAGGSTALFAGVSTGSAEVRKFLDRKRVNRVLLLSDGIANVGPSSPAELGGLGASLIKEGVSVTTIGLGTGYNEDLMRVLAERSDGNHYFAENATDLARVFKNELGDVLSVVAQEVTITITCSPGIRPVRVLGREADITGQIVRTYLNQLYSEQQKYVLLEVEVPATADNRSRAIADVAVTYANMQTRTNDRLTSSLSARFVKAVEAVEKAKKADVIVSAVEQIATTKNEKAVELRDKGKIEEARRVLNEAAEYLKENAKRLKSKELDEFAKTQKKDADALDDADWEKQRKAMVEEQSIRRMQRRR
jgi:Ca-activated chloride channel family protein